MSRCVVDRPFRRQQEEVLTVVGQLCNALFDVFECSVVSRLLWRFAVDRRMPALAELFDRGDID